MFSVAIFCNCAFVWSKDITDQFLISDPLDRQTIFISSDSVIGNNFLSYDFSGYSLRPDQVIDFGEKPESESLIFNTYIGDDWLDSSKSHYFEVCYWRESKTFEQTISGPSWFSNFHYNRTTKHEEYFYNQSGLPGYLVISWEENDFKVDGFRDYYYSLLMDGTTAGHRSQNSSFSAQENRPWLEISMQSIVGLGSNLSIAAQISSIADMVKDIADQFTILGGEPTPRIDEVQFNELSSNTSPYSFISSQEVDSSWHSSSWFGDFYKGKPGLVYHTKLGWLHYKKYTDVSSWCWHPALSWFWVSESTFPFIYLGDKKWSYLDLSGELVLVYDYEKEEWRELNQLVFSSTDTLAQRLAKIHNSFFSDEEKEKLVAKYLLLGE